MSKAEEENFELGENRQLVQGSPGAEQASVGPTYNKSGGADEKSFMDSSGHGFKVSSWNVAGMSVADIKNVLDNETAAEVVAIQEFPKREARDGGNLNPKL